jgi:hypothetical protein
VRYGRHPKAKANRRCANKENLVHDCPQNCFTKM